MNGRRGILASILSLLVHGTRFAISEYWYLIKRATKFGVFGLGVGGVLIWLGTGREVGQYLVPLGIAIAGFSLVGWLIITSLLWAAVGKAGEVMPHLGRHFLAVGTIVTILSVGILYTIFTGLHEHPRLLGIALGILFVVMLIVLLPGGAQSSGAIHFRLGLMLTAITVVIIYSNLPVEVQSRIFFARQKLIGLTPNKVIYSLESLRGGHPPFFQSIKNAKGEVEPAVWYYFDKEENYYHLYDGPGVYPKNGADLLPATRDLARKIIRHLEARERAEQQKLKNGAVAEQPRIEEEKKKTPPTEKVESPKTEPSKEDGSAREVAADYTRLKVRTIHPNRHQKLPPNWIAAALEESAAYQNKEFPANSLVFFLIMGVYDLDTHRANWHLAPQNIQVGKTNHFVRKDGELVTLRLETCGLSESSVTDRNKVFQFTLRERNKPARNIFIPLDCKFTVRLYPGGGY